MAAYDPQILQKFADRLYARAAGLTLLYAAFGVAIGGVLGFGFARYIDYAPFFIVAAVAGALIGAMNGYEKAFTLRLEAQRTLCVLQTEMNTRRDMPVAPIPVAVPEVVAPAPVAAPVVAEPIPTTN